MTMSTSPLGRSERFNTDLHVSEKDLVPVRSDGGIEIYAAFGTSAGLRDHLLNHLRPWLQRHVHWSLNNWQKLVGCYNEDLDSQTPLSHICSSHFSGLPTANLKCFVQRKTNVRRVSVMFFRPSALSSDFCTPSKKPVSRQPIQSHHLFHVLFHVLCLRAENDCAIAEPLPGDLGLGSQSCGPGR
jgi:hypothetical protein